MKKLLFLISSAVVMLACGCHHFSNLSTEATPVVAPIFTRLEQGVIGEDGALRIGPKFVSSTTIDFAKMDSAEKLSEKWTITNNYGNKLEIALGKRDGKSGLLVTRRDQPNTSDDTCFFMGSKSFAVAPGGRFRLSIGVCSDLNLDQVTYRGWGESRPNFIMWMDENDNDVKQDFITLPRVRSDRASENVITGDVPPNAAKAYIQLGADAPNLRSWNFILYTHVDFECTEGGGALAPSCTAVSRPIFVGKGSGQAFSWDADVPEGTSIAFKLFRCADKNGTPDGQWEESQTKERLRGAAGSVKLPFANCWMRYEATLTTTNDATPTLRRVVCGKTVDTKWSGADNATPVIRQISPIRVRDAKTPVELEITDDSTIDWSSLKVTLDDIDITAAMKRTQGGHLTYAPADGLAPNEESQKTHGDANFHMLKITVKDELGHEASDIGFVHVTDKMSPNHLSLRKDGAVLLNGKPFFPIGFYGFNRCDFNDNDFDKAFAGLKEAGVNTVHTYLANPYEGSKDIQELLAAAERHGVMVFTNAGHTAMNYSLNFSNILRQFSSPAMMAWYVGDDTATFVNADDVRRWSELLHRIDPDHLTIQADWISPNPEGYSNYYPFVHSTDGINPEIYSFYQKRDEDAAAAKIIRTLANVRRDIERNGNPTKTVWPIIQNFKGGDWHRFPNADELRVMCYEAIIHGANGITWFAYTAKSFEGATISEEIWKNNCRVSKELSALSDVILEEGCLPIKATVTEGPEKDMYDYPSISVLAKRHNGHLFLICANSAKADVAMKIDCPKMSRARVWFEDREVTLSDGILQDRFAPFGVHVYEVVE
jgi:hypothetical protein